MTRKADQHIRVTEETWSELNRLKRPGDSFDDVLQRLLKKQEGGSEGNQKTATPKAD